MHTVLQKKNISNPGSAAKDKRCAKPSTPQKERLIPSFEGVLDWIPQYNRTYSSGEDFSPIPFSSISTGSIQSKLTVGQPNDKYEREADVVADRIMRMPEEGVLTKKEAGGAAGLQRKCAACAHEEEELQMKRQSPAVQLKCNACEEEELQMKPAGGGQGVAPPALSARLSSSKGEGVPLPPATNSFMSRAIGADFNRVRIHTGGEAERMNRSLHARAFTHGSDIYFNRGEYHPGTRKGKRLLGHELTHVVQQRRGANHSIQRAHVLENDPATAPAMSCPVAQSSVGEYLFNINFNLGGTTLSATDEQVLEGFAKEWNLSPVQPTVRVDGFASKDGKPAKNWPLSCSRASVVAAKLNGLPAGQRIPAASLEVLANGETEQFSTSDLAPNRVAAIHAPGMPQPSSREPSVHNWSMSTSGTTAGDNCCALCPTNLGVDSQAPNAQNAMELTAFIRDHDPSYTYDIKRTVEAKAHRRRAFPFGVSGPWDNFFSKPAGSNDDSHNSDECLVPIVSGSTHKIRVIDKPGFPAPLSNANNALALRANFKEFIRITRSDGTTYDDSLIQFWHSKIIVEKISGTWTVNTAESDIGPGHLGSLDP